MIIYKGGVIRTVHHGVKEALAIDGERIAAVGDLAVVRAAAGTCEEIDLMGKCIVPGFIDSHCHLQYTGAVNERMNLRGARSLREIIERGRAYIAERGIPEGTWIIADGYDQNLFDVKEMPTRETADAITEKHPLLLERVCGHVGTLNSMGLSRMGFDENTVMEGGEVCTGSDGRPNGIVKENALYTVTFSQPKAAEPKAIAALLASGMRKMNSYGVTSVQSDDLEGINLPLLDRAIEILRADGCMTVRIFEELLTPDDAALNGFIEYGCRTGKGDEYYRCGNIKLILDGSLGARTAYMSTFYPDSDDKGFHVYTDEQVAGFIGKANAAGLQTACHAIGDAAAEQAITAVEKALSECPTSLKHRIVHGQFLRDDQLRRMRAAGMCADAQPAFVASDWRPADALLSEAQKRNGYRWRSMLENGLIVGGGSDSPVEECDPVMGMYCAVTRKDADGKPAEGWHPDQCVSAQQALEMYTTNAAKLSFEEDIKGELAPGMLADLAILTGDPLACAPEEIRNIKVAETIVGGRSVYRAE